MGVNVYALFYLILIFVYFSYSKSPLVWNTGGHDPSGLAFSRITRRGPQNVQNTPFPDVYHTWSGNRHYLVPAPNFYHTLYSTFKNHILEINYTTLFEGLLHVNKGCLVSGGHEVFAIFFSVQGT